MREGRGCLAKPNFYALFHDPEHVKKVGKMFDNEGGYLGGGGGLLNLTIYFYSNHLKLMMAGSIYDILVTAMRPKRAFSNLDLRLNSVLIKIKPLLFSIEIVFQFEIYSTSHLRN